MKTKPIIADPLNLDRAGIKTCRIASTFIYLARCGIRGSTIASISDSTKVCISTIDTQISVLMDLGLVCEIDKPDGVKSSRWYCITKKGWNVLTAAQPDFSMFQGAMEVGV